MKKAGVNVKMDSEKLLYLVIVVLIGIFILNLDNIYNFTVKLKNGEIFGKKDVEVNEPTPNPAPNITEQEYVIVKPVGNNSVTCTLSEQQTSQSGDKKTTVYLYDENNLLKSIKQDINYEGYAEEYTNYIYSQKKIYDNLKDGNISLKGFSVVSEMSGMLSYKASIVVDLSKVSISSTGLNNDNILAMYGEYDDNIEDVKAKYVEKGYKCE